MPRRRLLLVLSIVLASCRDLTSPRDAVLAFADSDGVLVQNRTNDPIVVMIIESELVARTDWVFCERPVPQPTDCGATPPHQSLRVPNKSIDGYYRGATASIFYARLVKDPQSGLFVRDVIRGMQIKLR
jgi:hypothetical protein